MIIATIVTIILCLLIFDKGLDNNFNIALFILSLVTILVVVFNIFRYNNRKMQFVQNRIAILLNFILLGLMLYRVLNLSGGDNSPEKGIELYVPLLSIVLLALANKGIKKDEELVKSVDRLR